MTGQCFTQLDAVWIAFMGLFFGIIIGAGIAAAVLYREPERNRIDVRC